MPVINRTNIHKLVFEIVSLQKLITHRHKDNRVHNLPPLDGCLIHQQSH